MGSRFSIEHTMTTLSLRSRITSSSYSFQPMMDSSSKTSEVGLWRRPAPAICFNSASLKAMPEPSPPMVKEGRTTTGYFRKVTASKISSIVWQILDFADSPPTFSTIPRNSSRFSPRLIASTSAPISLTPYFFKVPRSYNPIAAFNAV